MELGAETDESGDPPRVWEPETQQPGCAFTRSIGDSVGEGVGVISEPEITLHALREEDAFLVVASDGIWEFMTNQTVWLTAAHTGPDWSLAPLPSPH